ncbi:MAG: hypothetical protein H0T46_10210 [Deltaproteobacteria bacterium]|nr:hypothetical protein [Deltaproteobacteria bacterium]
MSSRSCSRASRRPLHHRPSSAAVGLRGNVDLGEATWLRPGLSYARGLDDPLAGRSYQVIQIDVPFVF